jgi:hypothetical protein
MTLPTPIIFVVAGSADPVLGLVVVGTVLIALLAHALAIAGWLRGRR